LQPVQQGLRIRFRIRFAGRSSTTAGDRVGQRLDARAHRQAEDADLGPGTADVAVGPLVLRATHLPKAGKTANCGPSAREEE
jgi:hypothetical protein